MYHIIENGKDVFKGTSREVARKLDLLDDHDMRVTVWDYVREKAYENPDWAADTIRYAIYHGMEGHEHVLIDMIEEAGMMEVPLILSDELRVEWMDDEEVE